MKKYKTKVEFVSPTVFDNADPQQDISITTLAKIEDCEEITEVKYTSGKTYNNVKLQNVNKMELAPAVYENITKKYKN